MHKLASFFRLAPDLNARFEILPSEKLGGFYSYFDVEMHLEYNLIVLSVCVELFL